MLNRKMKPIAAAVGALAASLAPAAVAETADVAASADPFETRVLEGVLLAKGHGEGGCGEDAEKKKSEGESKCGEGEGKCGEGMSEGDEGDEGDAEGAEDADEDEESEE